MPVTAERRFDAPPRAKSPWCARLPLRRGESLRFPIAERTDQTTIDTVAPHHLRCAESSARPVPVFERRPGQFPPCAVLDGRCSTIIDSAPTAA